MAALVLLPVTGMTAPAGTRFNAGDVDVHGRLAITDRDLDFFVVIDVNPQRSTFLTVLENEVKIVATTAPPLPLAPATREDRPSVLEMGNHLMCVLTDDRRVRCWGIVRAI